MISRAILVAIALPLLVVLGLWVWNYAKADAADEATRRTSRTIVGIVAGAVISTVIIASEIAGMFAELIAYSPEGFGTTALGLIAVLGLSGWVELGIVSATILVVGIIVVMAAVRGR